MNVIITGAQGQVGKALIRILKKQKKCKIFAFQKTDFDITNLKMVRTKCAELQPDMIINCAAYTQVDLAESEEKSCFNVNADGAKILAQIAAESTCKLIHFSSDYVYNSVTTKPLSEKDATTPEGVYASSKLKGEEKITKSSCDYAIIRTSWVYDENGNNFINTIIRLSETKKSINVVNDQIGVPTYAGDLAQLCQVFLTNIEDKNIWKQIYNYAPSGKTSWYGIAMLLKEKIGFEMKINPIPTEKYPTPAKRPKWSILNTKKIVSRLKISIPKWEESLYKCLKNKNRSFS